MADRPRRHYRRRDRAFMMRSHWTIGIALSAALAFMLATGLVLPAMLVFPVPVACFWLMRKDVTALSLLACAILIPTLMTGALTVGIIFGVVAAHGLLLGSLARKRVSLGTAVAVLTWSLFVFLAVYSAANWDAVHADWQAALHAQAEKLESVDTENASRQIASISEWFGWIENNLAFLYFGALLSGVMLMVAAVCVLLYWWLAAEWGNAIPPANAVEMFSTANYRFRDMRTPEHLVWLAILLAGLWFWDSRWPNDAARFVSWNGALALATAYWLNGLAIVLYVSHAWKWRPLWTYALLLSMVLLNVISALSIIGFFDTWIDFRRKALRAHAPRSSDDEDASDT